MKNFDVVVDVQDGVVKSVSTGKFHRKGLSVGVRESSRDRFPVYRQTELFVDKELSAEVLKCIRPVKLVKVPVSEAVWAALGFDKYAYVVYQRDANGITIEGAFADRRKKNETQSIMPDAAGFFTHPGNILKCSNADNQLIIWVAVCGEGAPVSTDLKAGVPVLIDFASTPHAYEGLDVYGYLTEKEIDFVYAMKDMLESGIIKTKRHIVSSPFCARMRTAGGFKPHQVSGLMSSLTSKNMFAHDTIRNMKVFKLTSFGQKLLGQLPQLVTQKAA